MTNNRQKDESAASHPSKTSAEQSEQQTGSDNSDNTPRSVHARDAANQRGSEEQSSTYNEPPPSYNAAMGHHGAAYIPGQIPPQPNHGSLPYPSKALPAYPLHPYVTPTYDATHEAYGPPPQVAQVITVGFGCVCPHCNVGIITRDTDMCLVICLLLLTILTFPLGLLFLCCLPCAFRYRCSNCNAQF